MFQIKERKVQYEELVMEHSEQVKKIKSADEQYLEETTTILSSTSKTQSVKLQYFEPMPGEDKETRIGSGHVTQKKDGWLCVDLVDDREMMVKEQKTF